MHAFFSLTIALMSRLGYIRIFALPWLIALIINIPKARYSLNTKAKTNS